MTNQNAANGQQEDNSNKAPEGVSPKDESPVTEIDNVTALDPQAQMAKEVERLNAELTQMKDKYLRAMAEMDNMRRRNDKEKRELLQFGQERLIQDLLPVLDSCDKAVGTEVVSAPGQTQNNTVVEGIKLVFKQLISALERHGLKAVEAVDKPFDPNLHQAISRMEMAGCDHDKVIQECSKGYLLHERLVRPSMVVVGVPAEEKTGDQ